MKVLFVNSVCRSGSTGKIAYDLYSQLRADGHDAAICYGRGGLCEGENIFRFAPRWEVYLHALLTRVTGFTGCFSPIATRRLIKLIEDYKPDVVHLHELHAYFVNHLAVMRYLKEKNIKTIWTFHCEYMYTGKCGYAYECKNWKKACGNCPHLGDYPKTQWFDRTAKMLADKKKLFEGWNNLTIVTPSQWLADRVKQSILHDKTVCVVHNGIDTEKVFYPRDFAHLRQRHGLTDQKVVLAVAPGMMLARKGGRHVLALAQQMKAENIKFILIGVEDLGEAFPDNVIALGRTENQQELAEYYSMADLFVICSSMENYPTTCLEALCCGTPVVGFDVGGTKETAPLPLGSFAPYGDLDKLAEAVLTMIDKKTELGEACVQYGRSSLSREVMYQEMMKLYNSNAQNAFFSK